MSNGFFITFEGGDGSGKSTQLTLLAQTLTGLGQSVCVTRNPGGSDIGQQLREILLHHTGPVNPVCELLLYMADRAQHVETILKPALQQWQIVLCDRYTDSTVAYQGGGRGMDPAMINQLNAWAIQGVTPDLTFLFDGNPALLKTRVQGRGQADRLEGEALCFHQAVRAGYLALAEQNRDRIVVLDATQSIEALQTMVLVTVQARLSAKT